MVTSILYQCNINNDLSVFKLLPLNNTPCPKELNLKVEKLQNKCDLLRSGITEYACCGLFRKTRKTMIMYPAAFNYSSDGKQFTISMAIYYT